MVLIVEFKGSTEIHTLERPLAQIKTPQILTPVVSRVLSHVLSHVLPQSILPKVLQRMLRHPWRRRRDTLWHLPLSQFLKHWPVLLLPRCCVVLGPEYSTRLFQAEWSKAQLAHGTSLTLTALLNLSGWLSSWLHLSALSELDAALILQTLLELEAKRTLVALLTQRSWLNMSSLRNYSLLK